MRPLKNYGVWTDDYSKHPQNPEYSGWVPHKSRVLGTEN